MVTHWQRVALRTLLDENADSTSTLYGMLNEITVDAIDAAIQQEERDMIETTIHRVEKITVGAVRTLESGTKVRDITFTGDGEEMRIIAFGRDAIALTPQYVEPHD